MIMEIKEILVQPNFSPNKVITNFEIKDILSQIESILTNDLDKINSNDMLKNNFLDLYNYMLLILFESNNNHSLKRTIISSKANQNLQKLIYT